MFTVPPDCIQAPVQPEVTPAYTTARLPVNEPPTLTVELCPTPMDRLGLPCRIHPGPRRSRE